MGYTSVCLPGEHFIDVDQVFQSGDPERFAGTTTFQPHGVFSKGMYNDSGLTVVGGDGDQLMPGGRVPFSAGASGKFPSSLIVPKSDWEGWIKDMEASQADVSARILMGTNGQPLPCLDQNGTNFCWANAPTHGVEVIRLYQNDDLIRFSPGSIAGPVNGFTNSGGWGGSALKRWVSHGAAPVSIYKANQVSKPSNFNEAMVVAANYKVLEWWELSSLEEVISCLLRGWPVAVGLNWWSHEVLYTNALWLDGTIAIRFRNSWGMSYGKDGFSVLQGSRMYPDDAVVPRVASPAGREKYQTHGAMHHLGLAG